MEFKKNKFIKNYNVDVDLKFDLQVKFIDLIKKKK